MYSSPPLSPRRSPSALASRESHRSRASGKRGDRDRSRDAVERNVTDKRGKPDRPSASASGVERVIESSSLVGKSAARDDVSVPSGPLSVVRS